MNYTFYHLLHLLSVFFFVGTAVWAVSNPMESEKKKVIKFSAIAAVIALLSGFGLIVKAQFGFPVWVIVKLIVWFCLNGVVAMAYKKRENRKQVFIALNVLVLIAISMVTLKPF